MKLLMASTKQENEITDSWNETANSLYIKFTSFFPKKFCHSTYFHSITKKPRYTGPTQQSQNHSLQCQVMFSHHDITQKKYGILN